MTAQAEELLRVGIRQKEDAFIVVRPMGSCYSRTASPTPGTSSSPALPCPVSGSMICATPTTHLLASGVHPKASERLGHSKAGITDNAVRAALRHAQSA
jgi:hypothetical protein